MGLDLTVFLLALVLLLVWLYMKFLDTYYKVWEKRGIPTKPGTFPYGSSRAYTREVEFQPYLQQQMYNEFSNHACFGFYYGAQPMLMVRDPEYVRLVMAKEFSHFRNRAGRNFAQDDYLSQHLFNLEGEKWRALRSNMSPIFSSGKLKAMFPLFTRCSESLNKLLLENLDKKLNVKEVSARFSTDVICACAFGWDVNSLENEEAPFRKIGKHVFQFDFPLSTVIKLGIIKYIPFLSDITMPKIGADIEEFMVKAVKETIEERKKSGVKRNDFIDLLIQLRNKGILNEKGNDEEELKENILPVELTDELMTAQCFVFFLAGFETSSSVQTFTFYELSRNQDIQERLHREIEETIEKHGGVTYQAVQEMQYLDMVVHEAMRKYPTLSYVTRRCTSPFTFPDGTRVERGDRIHIPIWSLHRDPNHFPTPEVFNPERFAPEDKDCIKPYTYLPFGEGPRICIGSRFGLLQTKMGVLTLIRKYKITPIDVDEELEFDGKSPLVVKTKRSVVLNLTKRT